MSNCASIVTVGNFDGVHIGHRALIETARALVAAGRGSRVVAMVFDPHPAAVIRPGTEPGRLSTFSQRERWLRDFGVDEVVRLDPRSALPEMRASEGGGNRLLEMSPTEFVEWTQRTHGAIGFVEGPDFRFGKQRLGTVEDLERLTGMVRTVPTVSVTLPGGECVPARSGVARGLIVDGRVSEAIAVLGRAYQIVGEVVQGDRRGRTIGFPTANLRTDQLLPKDGVYAANAELPDGTFCVAAVSVGTKPTFNGPGTRTIEAHLLGTGGPGRNVDGAASEYGWPLTLRFIMWVREQRRFDGIGPLLEQIKLDCAKVEELVLNNQGPLRTEIQ